MKQSKLFHSAVRADLWRGSALRARGSDSPLSDGCTVLSSCERSVDLSVWFRKELFMGGGV